MTTVITAKPFSVYSALVQEIRNRGCNITAVDVECQFATATGYVWGWQDAKNTPIKDSNVVWNFSVAYGIHAAEYALERRYCRLNIPTAWEVWCISESGFFDDWTHFRFTEIKSRVYPRPHPITGRDLVWACCESSIGPVCEHRRV